MYRDRFIDCIIQYKLHEETSKLIDGSELAPCIDINLIH